MSFTILGLVSLLVGRFLGTVNAPASDQEIQVFLSVGMQIVGAVGVWFGRWRQGDITWYGKKLQ